jgi:hypothetical protein
VPDPVNYRMVLSTDAEEFGGFNQIPSDFVYPMQPQPWDDRDQSIQVYLPSPRSDCAGTGINLDGQPVHDLPSAATRLAFFYGTADR